MNIDMRFPICGACLVVLLSVFFPGIYALLGNESSLNEYLSNGTAARGHEVVWWRPLRNDGELQLIGSSEQKRYFTVDEEEEGNTTIECSQPSINDFPADLFTYKQRRYGAVVLHAFLGFYCFVLTAMVCHSYLLPALDRICVGMNISTDVAGATFLAMASSFPEMFVNVIGTFLTESDLGVGTVVGSAVFDTFATPACGALTALHAIPLEWRILSRDCIMYVISVGVLVIIMWDGLIIWYEAAILLVLFVIYVVLLFCGKKLILCCGKMPKIFSSSRTAVECSGGPSTGSTSKLPNVAEISSVEGLYKPHYIHTNTAAPSTEISNVVDGAKGQQSCRKDPEDLSNSEKSEEYEQPENPFSWPVKRSKVGKFWFILTWPLKFLLFITIPDIRHERLKKLYPLTFIMCVIWIAISSYLVSWMMTVVGDTIGIPDSIMGITFLAAGGNVPELASIVILARQGDGNMAMSNTLGANILDILLCLGLPWIIKCLMTGKDVQIVSGALSFSVLSIVACIVVLYAVIAYFEFKLNKKVGLICLLLYMIFIVFATLIELNMFFYVNPPVCHY